MSLKPKKNLEIGINFYWPLRQERTNRCQENNNFAQFEQERWGSLVRTQPII